MSISGRRRSIGNSKKTVYEEGRTAGVPSSSVDGGYDGLEGSALLCGLVNQRSSPIYYKATGVAWI